ncbi:MAG: RCC1 domain-containing protein, partial [Roseiflexaceae bacterium]
CALTSAGAAYCWGYNMFGQLGDSTNTHMSTPVTVILPAGVTFASISVGQNHTCAITSTGTAYCWGDGSSGEIGDGTPGHAFAPIPVSMPAGVTFTSITAGVIYTCALTSAGAAYCWGNNYYGQIGDGTTTDRTTPVAVSMPAGVTFTSITAGVIYTCALTSAGAAY